jgi:hypothetical protein
MIPLPVIFAGVAAIAGFTGAWTYQENRYERIIAEQRAAQSALLVDAYANAKRETERLQSAKDAAERKAQVRIAAVKRDAAAASTALGMLSDAADTAIRTAQQSHSACESVAATSTDLLKQCSGRYSAVAESADQWYSETVTLREAWPK